MSQLGRLFHECQDTSGNASVGCSVAVYREGATVNGAASGATPLTVNVRHRGKIATGDSVFVNAASGTTYTATVVSATQLQISGFVGTLSLSNGDRLVPSNTQPTLYSDDQGGVTTANPLTSDSVGAASCWMNTGAYELLMSGGAPSLNARLFQGLVTTGEQPAADISGETDGASAVANIEDTYFALTTAGAKIKSWRVTGTEKASIDKDGTGIFPRIGQSSTATTGGAIRFVDGNVFPLTVAGVQAALDECEAAGGGAVYIPAAAGIVLASTSVKIGNRVKLVGMGDHASTATFIGNASTNVTAMVENKTQDGTQQYAAAENISINGNKASGALATYGLRFVKVYAGSYWRSVLVNNMSGDACLLDGGTANGLGPVLVDQLTVANNSGNNVIVNGICSGVHFYHLDTERPGTGKAALKFTNSAASASSGHAVYGCYIEESDATADGIVLDGVSNCRIDNVFFNGTNAANVVKITGATGGSDGAFAAGGHVITNLTGNLAVIIDDQVSGVQLGNAQGRFIRHYTSPVASTTLDTSQIVGVQPQRIGVAITAAATITPGEGSYFVVNGNTGINSITAAARDKGRMIILNFSGTPTVTDGSNLKMAGNLVATADDTLTMVCDGTNWIEIARSVN